MWRGLRLDESIKWVIECLTNKTLVCITDGSYQKEKVPNLCSVGWIMACKVSKRFIWGTLVEESPNAGSYRGKMLGMLAIRLILLAVEEHQGAVSIGNKWCCDNKGALITFEKKSQKKPSAKANTDIQRVLQTINGRMQSNFVQHHVKGHQDKVKKWRGTSFEEHLNSKCDTWAKQASDNHLPESMQPTQEVAATPIVYRLPLEAVCVLVSGVKQTTEVSKDLKLVIGKQEARKFYAEMHALGKGLMPAEAFYEVDWDAIRLTLSGKPKMYNQWYSKQYSGWCGTGKNMKTWKQTDDARCPNCNTLEEDAGHLMVCRCSNQSRLFEEHVAAINEWMESHFTEPLLRQLVTQYLRGRGTRRF